MMPENFARRGFLPSEDPATSFSQFSELAVLDQVGNDLPSLLHNADCRDYLKSIRFPEWPVSDPVEQQWAELRLYYVRLGFIASAYVNQIGQPQCHLLPANIAVPLSKACKILKRPPILSYDGYALYNWKRFDKGKPVALGNIDTFQNFVHLYDEHWFILIHVEIEEKAASILEAIETFGRNPRQDVNPCLLQIACALDQQIAVLKRIPEKMSPDIYFEKFRPYIRFFENVVYEGVNQSPIDHRGETGAQSSILPTLIAFMKIPHKPTELTNHLKDMRRYMPVTHRAFIESAERLPDVKDRSDRELFNRVLESIACFREVHYGWARRYIDEKVSDPRGTGGTPYMKWLKQLIEETRHHKIP